MISNGRCLAVPEYFDGEIIVPRPKTCMVFTRASAIEGKDKKNRSRSFDHISERKNSERRRQISRNISVNIGNFRKQCNEYKQERPHEGNIISPRRNCDETMKIIKPIITSEEKYYCNDVTIENITMLEKKINVQNFTNSPTWYEGRDANVVINGRAVTSQGSNWENGVATPSCCDGPNNRLGRNNKNKGSRPYYSEFPIVPPRTISNDTMASQRRPSRYKKSERRRDIIQQVGNIEKHDTVSRCNYTLFSSTDSLLRKNLQDNYYEGGSSEGSTGSVPSEDLYLTSDTASDSEESSCDTESSGSVNLWDYNDILSQNRSIFEDLNSDSEPPQLTAEVEINISNKSADYLDKIEKREGAGKGKGISKLKMDSTNENKYTGNEGKENIDSGDTDQNLNWTTVIRSESEAEKRYFGRRSDKDYSAGNSMWHPPETDDLSSSLTPPPSAMKKNGSTSGNSNGKKQRVQFDLDIEIHVVPRDSYAPNPGGSIGTELGDYGFEGQDNQEDRYSEYSNDVDAEEEYQESRDMHNQMGELSRQRSLHVPSTPFRVIKRETPTGRRGRRDSFDLMQKLLTQQIRERTFNAQKMGVGTDHERRYPRPQGSNIQRNSSPYRSPHTSYYNTREYRRQHDDNRSQMRMNGMSPEHFVAFYTRQQQLQQYLDHERRLRRQQLLAGNMKQQDKQRGIFHKFRQKSSRDISEKNQDEESGVNDVESGSDLGAYEEEHLPQVLHSASETLPKPRPYVQINSAQVKRKTLAQEDQARISSGYSGSLTDADDVYSMNDVNSQQKSKMNDVTSGFPAMTSLNARMIQNHPYTPRQVAEVMRSVGIGSHSNNGSIKYYSERNRRLHADDDVRQVTSMKQRQHRNEHTKEYSATGASTFAKLSVDARRALQHAHMAYTMSLKDLMPAVKSIHDADEKLKDERRDVTYLRSKVITVPPIGKETRYSAHDDVSQPTVRYRHGNHRGKIPESFARQQNHLGPNLAEGSPGHSIRVGSGHMTSCGSLASSNNVANNVISRPSTSESVTVNMLGLSARLPLNSRRSAQGQRSHIHVIRPVIPITRTTGDPYRRMNSGNKSPFSQKHRSHAFSFDKGDSAKYRNHLRDSSIQDRRNKRNFVPEPRGAPPQLRGNHYPYPPPHHGGASANPGGQTNTSSMVVPTKIFA